MSTAAQKSANLANSRLSTGPNTSAGKQKAAQNSAKHYLTAKQIVVPGEDPEAYESLREDLLKSWNPANTQEEILVDQIAQNTWRLMRVRRIEAATFEYLMPSLEQAAAAHPGASVKRAPANHDQSIAQAFLENAKAFDNVRRYATSIERTFHTALAELQKLQKERKNSESGSVSQKPEPAKEFSAISALNSANSAIKLEKDATPSQHIPIRSREVPEHQPERNRGQQDANHGQTAP
jgi:hypothetical protein